MSPEQCSGRTESIIAATYSLGCVMFEMIAGRPPFIDNRVRDVLEAPSGDAAAAGTGIAGARRARLARRLVRTHAGQGSQAAPALDG